MPDFAYIRDLNPQKDNLPEVVRIIQRHEGDNDAIAPAIRDLFDRSRKRKGYSLHSIKANTMTSLREENLGVMTTEGYLTAFGKKLLTLSDDDEAFRLAVAKRLILDKGGLFFCRGLAAVAKSSKGSYREQLATFLAEKYQVEFWRDHNNISSMHSFLEWAGVCSNYQLNEERFEEVVSIDEAAVKGAEELSPEASALLQALVRAGGSAAPGAIRAQAELLSGRRINPHNMPSYGKELEERDFIALPGRRGSKTMPWRIKKTGEMIAQIAASLIKTSAIPDEAFNRTFGDLLDQIKQSTRDEKGRALEYLAARMCWKLHLRNIEIRRLSEYEIDVRAEAMAPTFQKWILQCKATGASLGPRTILREYAIAKLENIPVIAFVTTSTVTQRARAIADQIMEQSNKVVLIFEGDDLQAMAGDESALYTSLQRQAEHARVVKVPQKEAEVYDEAGGETAEAAEAEPSRAAGEPARAPEEAKSQPPRPARGRRRR